MKSRENNKPDKIQKEKRTISQKMTDASISLILANPKAKKVIFFLVILLLISGIFLYTTLKF